MKIILEIISVFTEEDKQDFLRYLQKKNRRGDTKNSLLFTLIDSGQTEHIDVTIYGKPSKNAYHALCKRLQDALIDFLASKSFATETNEEMEIFKLILAARIFFEHQQYKIAFKTLDKAEKNAKEFELYSILTEIYHTKIQYAHCHSKLILSNLFKEAQQNLQYFHLEHRLNMAYAAIQAQLRKTPEKTIVDIVQDSFKEFGIKIEHSLTYKSLFQLISSVVEAAKHQSDFYSVSNFINEAYTVVEAKQDYYKVDKHLYYHLEILNLMTVFYFRNKDFKTSKKFYAKMAMELKKRNGVYVNRFLEELTLNKALIENFTGEGAVAIETLSTYPKESLHIQLTLAMSLLQQNKVKESYIILKNFTHTDSWYEKKLGWIWVVRKSILEILVLIELDKLEVVLSRLQSFKNKFSKRLNREGEERANDFIRLVSLYYDKPKEVTSVDFKEKVETTFNWIGREREDIFVMSFYAWLKAKMEQRDLYEVTLELVG